MLRSLVFFSLVALALLLGWAAHGADLPDAHLTPGVVRPDVTASDLCPVAHTPALRNVPESEKRAVYRAYGIDPKGPGSPFEVDHLISLELGGSNDIANLWPQSYVTTPWNARVKDKLENRLHAMICAGTISLVIAQQAIANDWIAAYKLYIGSLAKP